MSDDLVQKAVKSEKEMRSKNLKLSQNVKII